MLFRSAPLEAKISPEGIIEGHTALFGTPHKDEDVDAYGTIFLAGCWKKGIARLFPKNLIKFRAYHLETIGALTHCAEDSLGVEFAGKVSDTTLGRDVKVLVADRAVTHTSFGFDPVETVTYSDWTAKDRWAWEAAVRGYKVADLREISLVEFPSHEGNPEVEMRSERRMRVRSVLPFQSLPLAERDRKWSKRDAEKRVRAWAEAEDGPNAKYRKAFVWMDAEAPESFGSFKLMIADVIDDALTAVPKAIFAAAAVVQGARGGVDIPDDEMMAVKFHIGRYYAAMRKAFDDDSLIAPWDADDEDRDAADDEDRDARRDIQAVTVRSVIEDAIKRLEGAPGASAEEFVRARQQLSGILDGPQFDVQRAVDYARSMFGGIDKAITSLLKE